MRELRSSKGLEGRTEALLERLADDGYFYLPRFLDPRVVLAVQEDLRHALADIGWLRDAHGMQVARPDLRFDSDSFRTIYPAVQRVESFHRLAYTEELWNLMVAVFGDEQIFCHPAKVVRLSPPTRGDHPYSTRAHQDFVVQHTTSDALTVWIPLTECTTTRQGLRILSDSHRDGFLPTDPEVGGARPLYLPVDAADERWMTADYQIGDIVVFHSLTVHGGGPNTSDELRMSADIRYQRCSDPFRAEFAHPHGWPKTPDWDEICADWESRRWIEVPDSVSMEFMPADVTYQEFLSTLVAPPSMFFHHGQTTSDLNPDGIHVRPTGAPDR